MIVNASYKVVYKIVNNASVHVEALAGTELSRHMSMLRFEYPEARIELIGITSSEKGE